jgi:preflagellin peptidase FlaK
LFEGLQREPYGKKILVFISGYKVRADELEKSVHLYPLEDITLRESEEKRVLLTLPKDEERDGIIARISKAVEKGQIENKVWASPGLPMLIFITIGFVVALTFGDLAWSLVFAIMKK